MSQETENTEVVLTFDDGGEIAIDSAIDYYEDSVYLYLKGMSQDEIDNCIRDVSCYLVDYLFVEIEDSSEGRRAIWHENK